MVELRLFLEFISIYISSFLWLRHFTNFLWPWRWPFLVMGCFPLLHCFQTLLIPFSFNWFHWVHWTPWSKMSSNFSSHEYCLDAVSVISILCLGLSLTQRLTYPYWPFHIFLFSHKNKWRIPYTFPVTYFTWWEAYFFYALFKSFAVFICHFLV